MPLEVGFRLGHYTVDAKIGEGGMAEVYRARDTKLDRDVALKVCYQAQCMDTVTGNVPLGQLMPYGAPHYEDHLDLEALKRAYKPAGEWHINEIRAEGEELWVHLNGELITTATSTKRLTGHIGIQAERGLLEFRKIEVVDI